MNRIKDNTMNFIIDEAIELFLEKSIVSVTMSDIAKQVGVGEATLYRYFQKKHNIVMQASTKLSKSVAEEYFHANDSQNGYETMEAFFRAFETVFSKHPQYFKFINELDAYIITENVVDKNEYEHSINYYHEMFVKAYEKGLADKSVKKLSDPDGFYYSTSHSLLNLCKFLSTTKVLNHDEYIDRNKEIKIMADIILAAVKGE